ncbi:MAG: DNA-directed RNA polymerase subunit beta'', partial [Calditerricola sp.]|nr:DNA-directed RNA polymerase subunit beta'' [Calditerricola sp.]
AKGEGKVFASADEAIHAYQMGHVSLHAKIAVPAKRLKKAKETFTDRQWEALMVTTVGKIIFNEIFPPEFPFINTPTEENLKRGVPDEYFIFDKGVDVREFVKKIEDRGAIKKKFLGTIIHEVFRRFGTTRTAEILDKIKELGFAYSTKAGITIAISDIIVPEEKKTLHAEAEQRVETVMRQYRRGLITEDERYDKVISIWSETKEKVTEALMASLDKFNSIYMMANSGARGSVAQITQLAGMRGLMANPSGRIIEVPIKSNFREGLTVLEFFISTHGARKGLADTALRTADSGYLTRRLVDVAQDVIVREEDCGTDRGFVVTDIRDGGEVIETLYDRIVGRYSFETIRHPETGEVIVRRNEMIDEDIADKIVKAGIDKVVIRSVLNCRTPHGVCQKCYGRNLATGQPVEIGEAVGIIAAQSIGEPGTQLTMRTFHTGGVAGEDITQGLPRVQELFEARNPKGQATITEIDGEVVDIREVKDRREVEIKGEAETKVYNIPYGARLKVTEGQKVEAGDELTEGPVDPKEILKVKGLSAVQNYLLQEVQRVYRMQGVEINDKHIEVMIRQMLRKVRITDAGDTNLLPGSYVDIHEFEAANRKVFQEGGMPAVARPVLLGITKASLETESFLSAASFQETTRVLTDAAIKGKRDELLGLKENVIIGKLIPAGTGMARYRNVKIKTVADTSTDASQRENEANKEPVAAE